MTTGQIAREISYASSASTRAGRAMIRVMENASGRIGLIRRVAGYDAEVAAGRDFWQVVAERYGIEIDVFAGSIANIPATGPVVVVANHPFGVLDGLILGRLLSERRGGEFRILAHRVFRRSADLEKVILPISFDETREAMALNLQTRAEALRYLGDGGAVGIFPGGTVSTAPKPLGRPMDPTWRGFAAKMIARSGATVVPVYFDGANSRLFQVASHLHTTLRMGLLIREFRAGIRQPVRIAVGAPIPAEALAPLRGDSEALLRMLRHATYALSPRPVDADALGFEFEMRYRKARAEPCDRRAAGRRSDG